MGRRSILVLLGVAIVLVASTRAEAHLGSTKYLLVEALQSGARVRADVEALDVSMQLGLGEDVDEGALMSRLPELRRWLAHGITIASDRGACPGTARGGELVTRDERRFVRVEITYACSGPVRDLVLRDDTIFDGDPQHESFVRVVLGGDDDARILRRGNHEAELGAPPSTLALLQTYAEEGALHLATGYDHVLFLLALILAAGLVAARDGNRKALRDVALLVTAFTLGHSVTLIAAALEWVVLPSRPVESLIALSIVVVAALNVWKPEERREMPWLAIGFGLIHGFGFSSVLAEQGLPAGRRVLALLAFNVGIELAQLSFVALVLFPLGWLARHASYRTVVVRGGSVCIAILASVWLIDRVLG